MWGRLKENGIKKDEGGCFPMTKAQSIMKTQESIFIITVTNIHPPMKLHQHSYKVKHSSIRKATQKAYS